MKINQNYQQRFFASQRPVLFSMHGLIIALLVSGCGSKIESSNKSHRIDSMAILLAPHQGEGKLDAEIRSLQEDVRCGKRLDISIERLGWSFVNKARESFDSGFYKLAEQCALELDKRQPNCAEGLLLRGHVFHNLHKFKEAEVIARELVSKRSLPFDFGLLSDALMEQGKTDEAIEACQKMIDLRPDLHSYARAAHLRWLKGELKGAEHLMRMAADASSPRDPDAAAWVFTRLAIYQFQFGAMVGANQSCDSALELRSNYPPALLLRGRLLLAEGYNERACEFLRRAAELNALPEYQWAFAEALRVAGRLDEAGRLESELTRQGALTDPRTLSLFLATRGQSVDLALRLSREELELRKDVFTHDALAWALTAAGKLKEARQESSLALSEGTVDARLLFHAAVLTHKMGLTDESRQLVARAKQYRQTLLPSERMQLDSLQNDFATLTPASFEAHKTFSARGANVSREEIQTTKGKNK